MNVRSARGSRSLVQQWLKVPSLFDVKPERIAELARIALVIAK